MVEADHESDKVNLRLSNDIDPGRLVERPVWARLRPTPGVRKSSDCWAQCERKTA